MKTVGFVSEIEQVIRRRHLLCSGDKVLVTLSGGADSVALLCVLLDLGYECVAAHCNFHLRGEESMRDEQFVRGLCQKRQVECVFVDFDVDTYVKSHKVSVEMACRELRYEWFEQMRQANGCQSIAVAHHRDDDIETMFLNFMRGSGVVGASGIKYKNGRIIRPLLSVSRQDIEDYLKSLDQDYVVDSTNLENDFSRNKIRNVILPLIRECFPNAENGFSHSLNNLKSDSEVNRLALDAIENQVVEQEGNCRSIDLAKVKDYAEPVALLHHILSPYGFNVAQIENMLDVEQSGACFESGDFVAEVGREALTVFDNSKLGNEEIGFDLHGKNLANFDVQVVDNQPDFKFEKNPNIAYFDAAVLSEKLTLRHWQEGDRFTPFGMKGSKKVSDFFNDNKFSLYQKKSTWLLCSTSGILWIAGHRASSLFKVGKSTEKIVVLKYLL